MLVSVAAETRPGERRVALTPEAVSLLVGQGHDVRVEAGAGLAALATDEDYGAAGADVRGGDVLEGVDLVAHVRPLLPAQVARLRPGAVTVGFVTGPGELDGIRALQAAGVTALAMELIPRISRAQSMDALSSQALVAGYRCALEAAMRLPRFFPLFMTAAGTVPPAKVLVLGAGVAGLQAIATARRLGAVVSAFDTRPVVKEQVQSLGATFVELALEVEEGQDARGYATELSESQHAQEQAMIERHVTASDVVITTALIPGRPAPRLITAGAVSAMRTGSVIVDLAAETGGNCELTEPGRVVIRDGVAIVGTLNLPSTMPLHASQMYARNITQLLELITQDGELALDFDDEIVADACITHEGRIVSRLLAGAAS